MKFVSTKDLELRPVFKFFLPHSPRALMINTVRKPLKLSQQNGENNISFRSFRFSHGNTQQRQKIICKLHIDEEIDDQISDCDCFDIEECGELSFFYVIFICPEIIK